MKKNYFFAGMMALAFLTGCNNDMYEGADIAGSPLNVLANINQVSTRLNENGTQWSANDEIGVSDVNGTYKNVRYTTDGSGNFTSSTGLYVLGDGETTYAAYYPFTGTDSEDAGTIDFNILEDENCDFMYAEATATRSNANAAFTFTHQMTQIVITLTDSSQPAQASGTRANIGDAITYILKNVTVDGTFNTTDGSVNTGTTKGDITVETTLGSTSYVILPPTGAQEAIEIQVNIDGKTYVGTINPSMTGNTSNSYTIDFSTAEPGVTLTINSAGIGAWQDGNEGELGMDDLEEQAVPNTLEVGDFLLSDGTVIDKTSTLSAEDLNGASVMGVVYYVGNVYPSSLYDYESDSEVLQRDFPEAKGLALAINNATNGSATSGRFGAKTSGTEPSDFAAWLKAEGLSEQYISTTLNVTSTSDRMLGYNNTKVIELVSKETDDEQEIYTLTTDFMNFLTSYRAEVAHPETTSDWYLPSYAEWAIIQTNYATISESIQKAGGTLPQYTNYNGTAEESTEMFYWSSDIRGVNYAWCTPLVDVAEETNLYITKTSNGTKGFFRFAVAFK